MVMGCSNVSGNHKLPLQIIGKSKNPRVFKNKVLPSLAFYAASSNAWQTKVLFNDYFHKVFVPRVRQFSKENHLEPKALLLLDNASSHNDEDHLVSDDGLIRVMFFPPNVTSVMQPMDQNCLLPLKTRYRNGLLKKLLIKESVNLIEDLKSFTLLDAVTLICDCWDELPSDVIFRSWKKLLNGLDSYETLKLAYDSNNNTPIDKQKDMNSMLDLVNSLEKDNPSTPDVAMNDLQDWLHNIDEHSTSIEFSDDEIVQIVNGTYREVEPEEDSLDSLEVNAVNECFDTSSNEPLFSSGNDYKKRAQTALSSIENLISYYENNIERKLYLRHLKSEIETDVLGLP